MTLFFNKKWLDFIFLKHAHAKVVLLFAFSVMIYFHFFHVFYRPGGDSDGDFYLAKFILGMKDGQYISYHSPGMALFLILTGVLKYNSWNGLLITYSLMSIAIPFLIYLMISPFSKTWAMIISIICISSFIPFAYSRVETYDHLFLFFEFLSFLLVSRSFYRDKNCLYPYLIGIVMFITNMIKPILVFSFWIYFFFAFFQTPKNRKHICLGMALYLALMGTWVVLDRNWGNGNLPEWSVPQNEVQRKFAETYFQPTPFLFSESPIKISTMTEKDGIATKALFELIEKYTKENIDIWSRSAHSVDMTIYYPYELFGKYASKPENLVTALFQKPNALYFNFILRTLQQRLGDETMNNLLFQVAEEHGNTGVMGDINYIIKNPMKLISGPTVSMGWRNLLGVYYFTPLRSRLSWNFLVDNNYTNSLLLNPNAGPYSREFFSAVHFFIYDMPEYWEHHGIPFDDFNGDPLGLYEAFKVPAKSFVANGQNVSFYSTILEGWFYTMFTCIYGQSSSKLFTHVVYETIRQYPVSLLLFLDSFINEILHINHYKFSINGKFSDYNSNFFIRNSELNFEKRINDSTHLTEELSSKLVVEIQADEQSRFIAMVYSIGHFLLPLFFLSAFLLFPCYFFGKTRKSSIFLLANYLYMTAVFAIFGNFGSARYSDMFILLPLILTGLAFSNTKSFRKLTTDLDNGNLVRV